MGEKEVSVLENMKGLQRKRRKGVKEMKLEKYETPVMEIVELEESDVIVTSGGRSIDVQNNW